MSQPQSNLSHTYIWRIRQYILSLIIKRKKPSVVQQLDYLDKAHGEIPLFKLTLNQSEINERNEILITHHNKLIIRAEDEEVARQIADESVKIYANEREAKDSNNLRNPISPWLDSEQVNCTVYKGPNYPRYGLEEVVYPPDLVEEYDEG